MEPSGRSGSRCSSSHWSCEGLNFGNETFVALRHRFFFYTILAGLPGRCPVLLLTDLVYICFVINLNWSPYFWMCTYLGPSDVDNVLPATETSQRRKQQLPREQGVIEHVGNHRCHVSPHQAASGRGNPGANGKRNDIKRELNEPSEQKWNLYKSVCFAWSTRVPKKTKKTEFLYLFKNVFLIFRYNLRHILSPLYYNL